MDASSAALKYLINTVSASASDKGLPSCVISTINVDRQGDRVLPEGMDAKNFMKAPTLFYAHGGAAGYSDLPVGTVTSLEVSPGQGITASWKWLEGDPFAARVENAWNQGALRGTSIGFKPIKMTPNGMGGVDHEAWELLELSIAPVPANAECVRTLKALGLMDEPEANVALNVDELEAVKRLLADVSVQKRGRVVSAVNESRLRAAMDALANASSVLTEVLAQLMPMSPDDMDDDEHEEDGLHGPHDDDEMKPRKPKPMPMMALDDAAHYSLKLAEDGESEPTLRLMLAEDDAGPFVTLIDDAGHEPTFAIDPAVMRSVVAEAVREQLHSALVGPIGESIQRALDAARGRVQ